MRARTPLAGVALAALAFPVSEELAWAPEEGTVLVRSFREETDWGLTDLDQEGDLPDISGLTVRELDVVDELVRAAEGRPDLLRRTFETAAHSSEMEFELGGSAESYELALESPLEGATVSFEWDADLGGWDVESEDLDSDLLEGLLEDLDLRALLPEEAASEGDSWTVDLERLGGVLRPGGDLHFVLDGPPEGPLEQLNATEVIATSMISTAYCAEDVWGELRLEWTETREEEGRSLAVIELELEGDLATDATDEIAYLVEEAGLDTSRETELSMDWEVEGRGQLVWDLSAARFASFQLTFEGPAAVEMSWKEGGENPYRIQMSVGLDISTELSAEAGSE